MIGSNYTYKWVNLWDVDWITNRIVISLDNKNLVLRTTINDKQNYHWSTKTATLASGRLFTFSFSIFWDRTQRYTWQQILESIIIPEFNPWDTEWLYVLSWLNDNWDRVKCNASVYSTPQYNTMRAWDTVITWSFELFAPNPEYYSNVGKTNNWDYWMFGWFTMPFTMPFIMDKTLAEVNATNSWNFTAPCRIEIVWSIENPKITNMTTGKFYKLNKTTTNLVLDSTWTLFIVEDEWVNVKSYRATWSEIIRLNPWVNKLLLTWDSFDYESSLDWNIYYNDTFI
jgi:hypothetical protein